MRGWIIYEITDKQEVLDLGIKLIGTTSTVSDAGAEVTSVQQDCEMTTEVFLKLDDYWGKFIWGITEDGN